MRVVGVGVGVGVVWVGVGEGESGWVGEAEGNNKQCHTHPPSR